MVLEADSSRFDSNFTPAYIKRVPKILPSFSEDNSWESGIWTEVRERPKESVGLGLVLPLSEKVCVNVLG